jgi:hypothetical protein
VVETWLARAAGEFWANAGDAPPFPRDLELVVQIALPASLRLVHRRRVEASDAERR